ncbi:MAG: hypothetical protein HQK49_12225 [Oligoflexia bacterium]|nr:hypothetical protein [Oligoflexia bacterium]
MIKKCSKHKKFTKDCLECLNYYFLKPKVRMPIKATKIIKDKKTYTRKKRIKSEVEDI